MTDRRSLGRDNPSVLSRFDETELHRLWRTHGHSYSELSNQREPVPFSACHMWTESTQNGYPSVSQGHAASKIKIHMLASWIRNGRHPGRREVASHLCHRKLCINPNHLVVETIAMNNKRVACLGYFVDNAGQIWNLCPHGPPQCLRGDPDNLPQNWLPAVIRTE
jgi:hypothetical protein